MAGAQKTMLIEAPIATMFAVITDYERYPEFISDIPKVRLLSRKDGVVEVTYWLRAVIKDIEYTLRHFETAPNEVRWELVKGQMMRSNDGSWVLESRGDKLTHATYNLDVNIKGLLIPSAIRNTLIEVTLPRTMEAFKKRAETLSSSVF